MGKQSVSQQRRSARPVYSSSVCPSGAGVVTASRRIPDLLSTLPLSTRQLARALQAERKAESQTAQQQQPQPQRQSRRTSR